MKRSLLRSTAAWVTAASLLNPMLFAGAARADTATDLLASLEARLSNAKQGGPITGPYQEPVLTSATSKRTDGAAWATDPKLQGILTPRQKIALLRQKVKYVFILFQENRSYDAYFGTYPGANGLYSTYKGANKNDPYAMPAKDLASFNSVILNTDGTTSTITPFLIPRTITNVAGGTAQLWPEDTYSVSHAHGGYITDFHLDAATKSIAQNDGYALTQEGLYYPTAASGTAAPIYATSTNAAPTAFPSLRVKQEGEVALSHIDCDTIPFLWQYADRFTMFDNFHQTTVGPSTPNAIAMIAGQTGDTQWVQHGSSGYAADGKTPTLAVPNQTDNGPFAGSSADTTAGVKPPYGPDESTNPNADLTGNFASNDYAPNPNLTFASLPLSFMGSQTSSIIAADENPNVDLADVQQDLLKVAVANKSINWGWFQQGYDAEPFDGQPLSENAKGIVFANAPEHASYIVHHNGPQYFGYVGDNPTQAAHLHGQGDFYTALQDELLPKDGGVAYVRGGYYNQDGMKPADPNATVQASTPGNDDHPNYADAGISEASVADSVNAIARSKYWKNSVIIITYDETDGLYDHQPEQFRTFGPDGLPETGGPRIPAIVISPYAASHVISHVYSEHSAVIRFIDELFNLTPLADLPSEKAARLAGSQSFKKPDGSPQNDLSAADDPTAIADYQPGMGDLLEAFDDYRLLGIVPALPASLAETPNQYIHALPAYASTSSTGAATYGCQYLNITPTDYPNGYGAGKESDAPPQDFNPRPAESPGEPYLNINYNSSSAATAPASSTGPWDPQ